MGVALFNVLVEPSLALPVLIGERETKEET